MNTAQRVAAVCVVLLGLVTAALLPASDAPTSAGAAGLEQIDHLIVIYLENHSFDNLYGLFPGAEGLASARDALPQTDLNSIPYAMLPQPVDSTLRPPGPDPRFPANLPNRPFDIGQYVPPDQKVGDLIHRYYHEQLQINGGRMDRYVAWSDAAGLVMGYYDTSQLPLARWAEQYTLTDYFHQAAFGGSYLNHFWLVCACTPVWPNAPADMVAVPSDDPRLLQDRPVTPDGFAVNTAQPLFEPFEAGTPTDRRLPAQTLPHIGDRLDAAGISWVYYAGGWNDAVAGHPDPLFSYHHQPFNYFANVGGNAAARALHLKDETEFGAALRDGTLPSVSWIKPMGLDNEHPGYADVIRGERHAEELLRQVQASSYWPRTAVVITYDEFGGFWDHVAPPPGDRWGPGTRVPTLIISPWAKRGYVDHTRYDTTSILKLVETRWGLAPLGTRDAAASDLTAAFDFAAAPSSDPGWRERLAAWFGRGRALLTSPARALGATPAP